MRTPKYKAFYKPHNYIYHVTDMNFEGPDYTLREVKLSNGIWLRSDNLDDIILIEKTQITDKNGKEIYTGDILQLKRLDGSVLFYKIFSVKGGFAFNAHQDDFYKPQSEIYFYESTSDMQSSGFIRTLEIIGNVYENPELLEKKFAN